VDKVGNDALAKDMYSLYMTYKILYGCLYIVYS